MTLKDSLERKNHKYQKNHSDGIINRKKMIHSG